MNRRINHLRETANFKAEQTSTGVRIVCKHRRHVPKSRTIRYATWQQLSRMGDAAFDGSCIMDLGIGTHEAPRRTN